MPSAPSTSTAPAWWRTALAVGTLMAGSQFALFVGAMWSTALDPYDNTARFYLAVSVVPALLAMAAAYLAAVALERRRTVALLAGYLGVVAVTETVTGATRPLLTVLPALAGAVMVAVFAARADRAGTP